MLNRATTDMMRMDKQALIDRVAIVLHASGGLIASPPNWFRLEAASAQQQADIEFVLRIGSCLEAAAFTSADTVSRYRWLTGLRLVYTNYALSTAVLDRLGPPELGDIIVGARRCRIADTETALGILSTHRRYPASLLASPSSSTCPKMFGLAAVKF